MSRTKPKNDAGGAYNEKTLSKVARGPPQAKKRRRGCVQPKNRRSRPDRPRERRKSLRLEVGRPGLCIPGCSDTPECKGTAGVDLARVPVAHGRCRDTLRSWQQPEERKSCQISHHISRPAAALGQRMDETSKIWVGRGAHLNKSSRSMRSDAKRRTTITVR